MNTHPGSQLGFLDGTADLINAALNMPAGGYSSKTAATALNQGELEKLDVRVLIEELWKRMAVNWVEAGCQSRGKFNWRWTLSPKTASSEEIQSTQPEIILQRKIAEFSSTSWANETPTGSGLSGGSRGDPGGLDLAYRDNIGDVYLIELKVRSNTPVHAAFQVVRYGLALTLARLVDKNVPIISQEPPSARNQWRDAKQAHLRVLAPTAYYELYPNLGWFEARIHSAIVAFGSARGLPMTFGFQSFENAANLREEKDVVARLDDQGRAYPR